jgi:hypothetical protein
VGLPDTIGAMTPPTAIHKRARDVDLCVYSPEAADHGYAEFWVGRERVAFTMLADGEVVLRIDPRPDGTPVLMNAHSMAARLEHAAALLGSY